MKTRFLSFSSLAFLSSLFLPVLALAQQTVPAPVPTPAPQYYMPYWHGAPHMWGGGFWWGGPLMMLAFIAVCVLIFALGRRAGCGWHHHRGPWHTPGGMPGPGNYGDPSYSALQILNERFARGEIQKAEYEEKKAAILSTGPR